MTRVKTTKTGAREIHTARRSGGLDRRQIIEAAIELTDEAGLTGLTMRKLGTALGVDAMSVYGYFENKAALLDAVVEHVAVRLMAFEPPTTSTTFEFIIEIAKHYRATLLEHPNLVPLVASRPLPQLNLMSSIDLATAIFRGAGFEDDDIPLAADAMSSYALGFIAHEAGRRANRASLGEADDDERRANVQRLLESVPVDATVQRRMIERRLEIQTSLDQQFETGLRAMLRGLRSGLGHEESPASNG
ncbi:MAG: TetR/AcrR family transcriptional regulator C-terminal domain-containing protein [Ilumatobacteraceae bacterium]